MRKIAIRALAALALLLGASAAQAAFHLWRIDQIYTNADGSVQFVVLKECCGQNNENLLAGQSLKAQTGANSQTFIFPNGLPSNTANHQLLIATQGFANLGIVTPDYIMPANFVPIGGGSLNYAGVSQVSFGPLPTDGASAINSAGTVIPNVATNFAGQSASVVPGPTQATVIEFYNASLDHYFITHHAQEISDLDNGVHVGWARTGESFQVSMSSSAQTSPVCRYYIPPPLGDSHFYGRGVQECTATGQAHPSFDNEDSQFFFVILPDAGNCPAGTVPVYRVFDNRTDANHRYMVKRDIRDAMVSQRHWIAEGDGPDLVVMCVPPTPSPPSSSPAPDPDPPMDPMPPGYGGGY
ncbi:MAG TPA: hypothetical protein VMN56_21230 [Casimicrobiaceae bacterium]|nr:hypothetical protein [Casimicrobiaceae bacterium]